MKIIYYSPHPTHDIVSEVGYSTHQRETISAMKGLGHEVIPLIMGGTVKQHVDVFHTSLKDKGFLKRAITKWMPLFLINALKDIKLIRHDKKAAAKLRELIAEFKPDLVYERSEYLQDKGTLVCKQVGIKHFLEVNAPLVDEMRTFEGPNLLHYLGHLKERRKLKNTSKIFAVSSALKSYLEKRYHAHGDISVIPNCINLDKIVPSSEQIRELRETLDLGNKTCIGFVGSIFPYHGVDQLILAFELLIKKHENVKLVVVGGGELKEELEKRATKILPQGSFVFTGKVPHAAVMGFIGAFDIAVMPASNWYGSPVKILEYGWMKKPIVAPNNGPLNDIISNKVEGILVDSGIENLMLGLEYCIENKDESEKMAELFYQKITTHYTWKIQANYILSWV